MVPKGLTALEWKWGASTGGTVWGWMLREHCAHVTQPLLGFYWGQVHFYLCVTILSSVVLAAMALLMNNPFPSWYHVTHGLFKSDGQDKGTSCQIRDAFNLSCGIKFLTVCQVMEPCASTWKPFHYIPLFELYVFWLFQWFLQVCGGIHENGPHGLMSLNAWSPESATLWQD